MNVEKTYDGEVLVLNGVNLDVRKGEFVSFLGPSGSGKTTALLLLAGFELATRGEVRLAGRSLHNVPPNRRDIGMVFQNYALFPHKTVSENLAFPLIARRRPKDEIQRRVAQALDMVQLGGYEKRRPAELSGGQQQRVAVARALIFEPKLVLMDEPLSALDRQLRERMQVEIKHLHERVGVTTIYVTHDQSEALVLSDRIAVFSDGEIEQLATPKQLYREPETSFVASFIGDNNLLEGRVTSLNGTTCSVDIDGSGTVQAIAVKVKQKGDRTRVSVPADCIAVNPLAEAYPNNFEARVLEVLYLGDYVRVRVAVFGREDVVIKRYGWESAEWARVHKKIQIAWRQDDCRALDAK